MGRHAPSRHVLSRHVPPRHGRRRAGPGPAVIGVAAVTVIAVAAAVWVVTRPDEDTVRVTVAPEVGALVRDLLSGPIPVHSGRCTIAEVATEEPLRTLAGLAAEDTSAWPQIWVPDDSSWATRAGTAVTASAGPLGETSLVLATSRAVAEERGWLTAPPATWAQALTAPGSVVADPIAECEGLLALAAVQTGLGPGEAADTAVTQLVLTAGGAADSSAALTDAVDGTDGAPVVVATEHQVAEATADGVGDLVVVVPTEGAPVLALPVLSTAAAGDDAAVDAVLARLSDVARDGGSVRAAGWRDAAGRGPSEEQAPPVLALDAVVLNALLARVASLVTPSRLLTVVDVSSSMNAAIGPGTRATVARDALTSALSVLPDRTTGGLWVFAARLVGDQDWQEVVPPRPFGTVEDGQSQRALLAEQFAALPDLLSGGGTGLHDTVLAAVRAAREGYDAEAVNTVVLLTDGTDDDPAGISESDLLATLASEVDPARPVQVIAVGVGPDADLSGLESIVGVTGGAAYSAEAPNDLRDILVEAVRLRP
jgi:Ca-activated chloride channel family protein